MLFINYLLVVLGLHTVDEIELEDRGLEFLRGQHLRLLQTGEETTVEVRPKIPETQQIVDRNEMG